MSKALRQRLARLEARHPPAGAPFKGLRKFKATGELPSNPRVRQHVLAVARFVQEAKVNIPSPG